MSVSDAGFDTELATREGRVPNLLTGELCGALQPGTGHSAYAIGVAGGVPPGVARGFLTELGLDEDSPPGLLLDFDAEDLATAKRAFSADEFGSPATALHRAQVTSWMRLVGEAVGPRALGLLDVGFVASPPTPRPLLSAPSGPPAVAQLRAHSRADPLPEITGIFTKAPAGPRLFPAAPKATAPPQPLGLAPPPPPALAARRMGDVVDQGDPGVFTALTLAEVDAAWRTHARLTGLRPRPEAEPSPEQLGALRAKLALGEAPSVDFAIWGPHDRRRARDRRSMAMVWVDGALQPRTLTGPGSFEAWEMPWHVFAAAMLSLGAAAPGALGRYRDGVRELTLLYPSLWGVIARADEAMRFEQWPRMAAEAPPHGDWSVILAASAWGRRASDSGGGTVTS